MHAKLPHPFDDATRVTAGDSSWQGHTSDDYWAFVGPFGGATAATILRALMDHPERSGDPLAVTVNYCAPIAKGPFDLDVRLVKANRSSQHWSVELSQGGGEVATLATAAFAERRPSWEHRVAQCPDAKPFEETMPFPKIAASWANQYEFRFVEGEMRIGPPKPELASTYSKLWISDREPRKLDMQKGGLAAALSNFKRRKLTPPRASRPVQRRGPRRRPGLRTWQSSSGTCRRARGRSCRTRPCPSRC